MEPLKRLELLEPFPSKRFERLEQFELLERFDAVSAEACPHAVPRMAIMMETVNASRARNQPLAVIDGGLSIKNGTPTPPTVEKPKLLDQVRQAIRTRHYSPKIYTHVLNRGGRGVESPADRLLKI